MDRGNGGDKSRGKAPTNINKELLSGKSGSPKEKILQEGKKNTDKSFTEKENIKRGNSEPPKSNSSPSKGSRGGGGGAVPSPFQKMWERRQMLPNRPLSENEKAPENSKEIEVASLDNKTELMQEMKGFQKSKPDFLKEREMQLEPEQNTPEMDMSDPSTDGDSGADGGADGGGDGGGE